MEEIEDHDYIEIQGNHFLKDIRAAIEPDLDDSKTARITG